MGVRDLIEPCENCGPDWRRMVVIRCVVHGSAVATVGRTQCGLVLRSQARTVMHGDDHHEAALWEAGSAERGVRPQSGPPPKGRRRIHRSLREDHLLDPRKTSEPAISCPTCVGTPETGFAVMFPIPEHECVGAAYQIDSLLCPTGHRVTATRAAFALALDDFDRKGRIQTMKVPPDEDVRGYTSIDIS